MEADQAKGLLRRPALAPYVVWKKLITQQGYWHCNGCGEVLGEVMYGIGDGLEGGILPDFCPRCGRRICKVEAGLALALRKTHVDILEEGFLR